MLDAGSTTNPLLVAGIAEAHYMRQKSRQGDIRITALREFKLGSQHAAPSTCSPSSNASWTPRRNSVH
jgi:hypothetical protein